MCFTQRWRIHGDPLLSPRSESARRRSQPGRADIEARVSSERATVLLVRGRRHTENRVVEVAACRLQACWGTAKAAAAVATSRMASPQIWSVKEVSAYV